MLLLTFDHVWPDTNPEVTVSELDIDRSRNDLQSTYTAYCVLAIFQDQTLHSLAIRQHTKTTLDGVIIFHF